MTDLAPILLEGLAPDDNAHGDPAEALRESNARFAILTDAMPQMVWSTRPDGYHDYYNARWYEFTGMPAGSTDGEGWNGMFHPDDQDQAWARWRHSLATGEPYDIEYRLRHHSGTYRWTLGRALPVRDDSGRITRWIGTCTDIDDAKQQSQRDEILSRELSHRIKNIFAVVGSLIGLSARRDPAAKAFADDLRGRVSALARAHEFVRPHSAESQPLVGESTLRTMLTDLLSAYPASDAGRVTMTGDDVPVDDQGATPIALVFHELATNAAKYGALSVAEGRVAIEIAVSADTVTIGWREHISGASSAPVDAPTHTGFGTRLIDLSIVSQLGGTIDRTWHDDGLAVTVTVDRTRLVRA